jgi:hypothetical protein
MQSVAIATLVMHVKIVNLFKWTRRGNFVEYNNDENRRASDDIAALVSGRHVK